MRFIINGLASLALVLLPVALSAQAPDGAPACHADLNGSELTTTIEFPNGYVVRGPWQVEWNRAASLDDGSEGVAVGASLDRVVEVDPQTGDRRVTPFPEPIETTFEGQDEKELVYRAAQIWCLTVLKAQEKSNPDSPTETRTRTAAR